LFQLKWYQICKIFIGDCYALIPCFYGIEVLHGCISLHDCVLSMWQCLSCIVFGCHVTAGNMAPGFYIRKTNWGAGVCYSALFHLVTWHLQMVLVMLGHPMVVVCGQQGLCVVAAVDVHCGGWWALWMMVVVVEESCGLSTTPKISISKHQCSIWVWPCDYSL